MLHGKELSYNNILDLDSALRLIRLFEEPAACVLKHNNPCGAAIGDDLAAAFERAYEGDPVSAFGGIVGLNRPVDLATAELMCTPGRFLEAIVAPGFEPEAVDLLTTKPTWKNSVRLIDLQSPIGPKTPAPSGWDLRRIEGGMLAQSWDDSKPIRPRATVKTKRAPTADELRDLGFAWKICAMVKSNAIVVVKDGQLLGVGAGQMSRLDSVRIAVEKAGAQGAGGRAGLGRVLPVPRRTRRGGGGGRRRHHPARRIEARRRDRSRPATNTAWPWSSPAAATSGIERARRSQSH